MEEIIFYLVSSDKGVEASLVSSYINNCVLISIFEFFIIVLLFKILLNYLNCKKIIINLKIKNKKYQYKFNAMKLKKISKLFFIIFFIIIICIELYNISLFRYIKYNLITSNYIEDNYINPKKTKIDFPQKKKNLIYIYVESLESSYFDKLNGGVMERNIIEPILELTKNNINFSDNEKIGGGKQVVGTGWTTGGLVATTSALPVKASSKVLNSYSVKKFMSNTATLGDILEENGYTQELMIGSDKRFGNRDNYFQIHGNYFIYDIGTAKENKKIPDDYSVWWGFEDSKLFRFAKEELLRLSEEEKPFNFTMLTANTHFPDGYIEDDCQKHFDDDYSNAIYCSAQQINEFIEWVEEQDFYDNTLIVINGDHLTMQSNYINNDIYERSIYNLFINSSKNPVNTKNRTFTSFDIFPSVISALGAEIEGNRLGLGTDLFSDEKTLPEEIGIETFDKNLSYKSKYYDNHLLK